MPDLESEQIPALVETIHFIAICGTGMGALACMLKKMGYKISGSDQNIYPPISDFLNQQNIVVSRGFSPAHLAHKPDLVIVGNAVSKENPEVQEMISKGLNYCSMPQAINRFVAKKKRKLIITGTHGKTTTAAILTWILFIAGLDPSYIIGGILTDFNSNYRLGKGNYIIIEGDEYDTAFFDKGAKFMHYNPFAAILTSVEFDHADIFADLDHVKQTFADFINKIETDAGLMIFDNDGNISEVIKGAKCHISKYGKASDSLWALDKVDTKGAYTIFSVLKHGKPYGQFKTSLIGTHNLYNALACIGVADQLGISKEFIKQALLTFGGVWRRQQIRGVINDIIIMDDFAHHPTAVRETISAVKSFYKEKRLVAVFEPRTNSSMQDIFQHVYPLCFDQADLICIRKPPLLKKIPPGKRLSAEKLVADIQKRGKNAHYFNDTGDIIQFLLKKALPGDIILIMSNGGFDNIHTRLLNKLENYYNQ